MYRLKNYVAGQWVEGTGKGTPLINAVNGDEVAIAGTDGIDFAAMGFKPSHHAAVGHVAVPGSAAGVPRRGNAYVEVAEGVEEEGAWCLIVRGGPEGTVERRQVHAQGEQLGQLAGGQLLQLWLGQL